MIFIRFSILEYCEYIKTHDKRGDVPPSYRAKDFTYNEKLSQIKFYSRMPIGCCGCIPVDATLCNLLDTFDVNATL